MIVNADAPGAMARAAATRGLPFLHVSTDYVFEGGGDRPWREDDPVAPLNAYGRSKLAGERAVIEAGGPHAILRTAWVHAAHGANFLRTMLRLAETRDTLMVVDDQIGDPTPAFAIAEALITAARALRAGTGASGVVHFAGAPSVSWRGFAQEIVAQAAAAGVIARVPDVVAISSADFPTKAARPRNSRLDCTRIVERFDIDRPDWRKGVSKIIDEIASGEG
jgi:dTDP-4-dehydrorhamnose reductase